MKDHKKPEEELKQTNADLTAIMETSPEAIITLSRAGIVKRWNRAAEDMFGWSKEEVINMPLPTLSEDRMVEFLETARVQSIEKQPCFLEMKWNRKQDEAIDVSISAATLRDIDGKASGLLCIISDISERKRLQAQAMHASKMEAIGKLAGGIVHDFNNILTVIISYGNLLKMRLSNIDECSNAVEKIINAAERGTLLTSQILTFSRRHVILPEMINVCELLRGIESELRTLLRENIQFQVVLPDVPVMLMVDVLQFERVLMNLVTNARDAMPAGGSLVIQVEYRNIDRAFIKAHGFGEPGTYVGIAISDTGVGIEKDKIKSIFEPFFTTKKVSKGTGLGLALVYGIVKEHSGYITVYSEPDRGTTLRLYFPITEASSEAVKGGPPLKSLQGSETILLVEDETPLRSLVKSVLEEFGYTVFAVQDGDEAVRCFIEEPSRYDLVVIDMIMPKRDGKAVYGEIKKTRPDIKVIFTSGYTEDILRLRNILDTKHVFIEKPFSPVTMLAKIRNVLGTTKTSEDLGSSQERASYN